MKDSYILAPVLESFYAVTTQCPENNLLNILPCARADEEGLRFAGGPLVDILDRECTPQCCSSQAYLLRHNVQYA